MKKLLLLLFVFLAGCTGIPEGITVVDNFALDRYLGTWYEVARLDNKFEKNFEQVVADYSLSADGSVKVVNRGFDTEKQQKKTVEGRALFVNDKETAKGALKVSFFGPFYGSYNVIALDRVGYRWAMVCGRDRSYFWILSREPQIEPALMKEIVAQAKSLGFDTAKLHFAGTFK